VPFYFNLKSFSGARRILYYTPVKNILCSVSFKRARVIAIWSLDILTGSGLSTRAENMDAANTQALIFPGFSSRFAPFLHQYQCRGQWMNNLKAIFQY